MPLSSQNVNLPFNRKAKIVEHLTADWGGIDHPLWRNEAAEKLLLAIETFLCIIAMSDEMTPETNAAAAAIVFITGWTEEEFNENARDVYEKVILANNQEGGMQ
jgi:hypothetical protein